MLEEWIRYWYGTISIKVFKKESREQIYSELGMILLVRMGKEDYIWPYTHPPIYVHRLTSGRIPKKLVTCLLLGRGTKNHKWERPLFCTWFTFACTRTVYKSSNPFFEPQELNKQKHMANQTETQIPEKYVTVVAKMERSVMELHILKSIISNGIAWKVHFTTGLTNLKKGSWWLFLGLNNSLT